MYILSQKENTYVNAASEEAAKSTVLMRHGCVAVLNGKIIARGFNNTSRTYSRDQFIRNTCSCHAEAATLRELFHSYTPNIDGKFTDLIKGT